MAQAPLMQIADAYLADDLNAQMVLCTNEKAQDAVQHGMRAEAGYVFVDGSGGSAATTRDSRLRRCGGAVVAM